MSVSIDVSEVRSLASDFRSGAGRIGARGAAVLRRTAFAIEADAKASAPVDTGNLRSSIATRFEGDGRTGSMTAEVGASAQYAPYVELGTSTQAGQPFLGPAFDRQVGGFEAAMAAVAQQII